MASPNPPAYDDVVRAEHARKAGSREYGATTGADAAGAGPAWLYHFPQQSQFNSPFASLQYEDLEHSRTIPVTPATIKLDLGEDPVQLSCPYCHQVVVTMATPEIGCFAYALSALLCIIGCWPCAVLPCCIAELMDVEHTCPNCKRYLDTYRREESRHD